MKNNYTESSNRIFELDFLRGLAIIMMIGHHLMYDLRHIMELNVFAWQESSFFLNILRPPFVFSFLFVSGICCVFSRNNFLRSMKLFLLYGLFFVAFFVLSIVTESELYIVSNIILVLAFGTFICSIVQTLYKHGKLKNLNLSFIFLTLFVILIGIILSNIPEQYNVVLAVIHKNFKTNFSMADYMPLVPWLSMFFFGAYIGQVFYKDKKTLFPNINNSIKTILSPFVFVGRYSLWFYILHQPVILAILFLLRKLTVI